MWSILLDRSSKGTLLPGCCREDEVAFRVRDLQAAFRAKEKPEPDAAFLLPVAACLGYETALYAANETLARLPSPL